MGKKYVSPIIEALDVELEDVLHISDFDNEYSNDDDEPGYSWGDFDKEDNEFIYEEDFDF